MLYDVQHLNWVCGRISVFLPPITFSVPSQSPLVPLVEFLEDPASTAEFPVLSEDFIIITMCVSSSNQSLTVILSGGLTEVWNDLYAEPCLMDLSSCYY